MFLNSTRYILVQNKQGVRTNPSPVLCFTSASASLPPYMDSLCGEIMGSEKTAKLEVEKWKENNARSRSALSDVLLGKTLGSVDVTVMFTTYINTAADRALHSCLFQRDGAPCQGVRPLWGAPPSQPEWALVVFSERTCPVNGGRRKICCRHLSIWIQDAVKDVCSPGLDGRKQHGVFKIMIEHSML